jgi:hypothetical protein
MNSTHFKNLFDTLSSTIISVIKEKIDRCNIQLSENIESINISYQTGEKHFETSKIKILSSELIELENNTSIDWEQIKDFNDLLLILEYVEDWFKMKADESFQIEWSIYDFEDRASEIEERTNDNNPLFDRSKFPFALRVLEKHYDCNFGVSWDDIDNHLDEYCSIN